MEKVELPLEYEIRFPEKPSSSVPVLFMLHGFGSNEQDLFSMSPSLPGDFLIISLRAPLSLQWGGFAWYEIDFIADVGKRNNIDHALQSLGIIEDFISKALKVYAGEQSQVWLMGFSQGSILSYALAYRKPDKINKVIALSGYMLEDIMPEKPDLEKLRQIDFFVSHGIHDDILPVEWGREAINKLKSLNVPHLYKEYPVAHGVNQDNFMDMNNWIKENLENKFA